MQSFFTFTESYKNLLKRKRGNIVGGLAIVFTKKAVVDETFNQNSINWFKSIVEIDASQLSLSRRVKRCQLTRDDISIQNLANLNRVKTRRGVLKTWSCHTFSQSGRSEKWNVPTLQVFRKNLMHTVFMTFLDTATLCLKQMVVIIVFPMSKSSSFSHCGRNSETH